MSEGPTKLRSEEVYAVLREEITDGVLSPGVPLVEDDIAHRLGVSRTPVRESIQRLAADGLVVSRRRRWIVHQYSAEEVAEIYDVRAGLEAHAARLAAQRATAEDLERIEAQRDLMTNETLIVLAERAKANDHFHDLITSSAKSDRMLGAIRDHRLFHFNRRLAALYDQSDLHISSQQHGQLIDALVGRDADSAGEIARVHIEFSLTLVLQKLY